MLAQFKLYLLSLLATSDSCCHGNDDNDNDNVAGRDSLPGAEEDFGAGFMAAWLKGSVWREWRGEGGVARRLVGVEPRHVCAGELSMGDLKRSLVARASDYGLLGARQREQVALAVQEAQRVVATTAGRVGVAVGGAWRAASSAVSSWWYSGQSEEDR